jgi:hypothetical protein
MRGYPFPTIKQLLASTQGDPVRNPTTAVLARIIA